jgi:hypothetical protein
MASVALPGHSEDYFADSEEKKSKNLHINYFSFMSFLSSLILIYETALSPSHSLFPIIGTTV